MDNNLKNDSDLDSDLEAQLDDMSQGVKIDDDSTKEDDLQKGDAGAVDINSAKEQMNQEDGIEIL